MSRLFVCMSNGNVYHKKTPYHDRPLRKYGTGLMIVLEGKVFEDVVFYDTGVLFQFG